MQEIVVVYREEPGNLNVGLNVEVVEAPDGDIADVSQWIKWEENQIIVICVKDENDEWQGLSAEGYEGLMANLRDEQAGLTLARTFEGPSGPPDVGRPSGQEQQPGPGRWGEARPWGIGDEVRIDLSTDDDGLIEAYAIAYVKDIDGNIATCVEASAFHRLWGESTGDRGTHHHIPITALKPCPNAYKHLVREYRNAEKEITHAEEITADTDVDLARDIQRGK